VGVTSGAASIGWPSSNPAAPALRHERAFAWRDGIWRQPAAVDAPGVPGAACESRARVR
jgi:hypothetical protein